MTVQGASRRRLLNWLLSTSTTALLAVLLYPLTRFVIPPENSEEAAGDTVVGKVRDFPPNSGKVVRFGSRPAVVIHTPSGQWRAFSATCTHLQCTVQYRADREAIWCACHNGWYDLTGRNVKGPPPRPLDTFDVAIRGDDIVLSRHA